MEMKPELSLEKEAEMVLFFHEMYLLMAPIELIRQCREERYARYWHPAFITSLAEYVTCIRIRLVLEGINEVNKFPHPKVMRAFPIVVGHQLSYLKKRLNGSVQITDVEGQLLTRQLYAMERVVSHLRQWPEFCDDMGFIELEY